MNNTKEISFTSWLHQNKNRSDLSNLLSSYIEEDWWPTNGKTLSDFLQAARKIIPLQLLICSYNEYRYEKGK